jgi:hypothetical protein
MMVVAATDPTTLATFTHFPLERTIDHSPCVVQIHLEWLSAIALLLAAGNHLLVVLKYGCCRRVSPTMTAITLQLVQRQRWMEYALSASCMHVQVALLSGILDLHLLLTIVALTASTMTTAIITDTILAQFITISPENTQSTFRRIVVRNGIGLGCGLFAIVWLLIGSYFVQSTMNGNPPFFVWLVMIVILVLDASFALVYYQQVSQPATHSGENTEIWFGILSLCSKQALAWIPYFGVRALRQS